MRGKIILIFQNTSSYRFSPKVKFYEKRHFDMKDFRHFQDYIKFKKKSPEFMRFDRSEEISIEFKKIQSKKPYKPGSYNKGFDWVMGKNDGSFLGFAEKL